jgi:hypothetical protein
MDAPPLPADRRRELAALRTRAYGPDADINGDADALARLIELEELVRADAPSAVQPADRGGAAKAADGAEGAPDVDRGTATAVLIEESAGPIPLPQPRGWWRRVPVWAWVLAALSIGLAVGFVAPGLGQQHPVTTLERVPIEGDPLDLELYGVRAEPAVRYESFHDLQVWSARTVNGSSCIVVATDAGEWIATSCAPEPLEPTADVTFFEGMRPIDGLELPDGSLLRFVLREDVMEVWIAETAQGA